MNETETTVGEVVTVEILDVPVTPEKVLAVGVAQRMANAFRVPFEVRDRDGVLAVEPERAEPRRGGPERCLRPCVECPEGRHHFSDAMTECAETSDPNHPAAKAGCLVWYECKHCPAWMEWTEDEDLDEDDPDDGMRAGRTPAEVARAVVPGNPEAQARIAADIAADRKQLGILEPELRVFRSGNEEWVVAFSAEDAAAVWSEVTQSSEQPEEPWTACNPARTIAWTHDDGGPARQTTFAELAKQGRGYLGSANY